MKLVNPAKLEIKLGGYAVGQQNALIDPLLVSRTQDYRRHIASRMVPLEPDQVARRFSTAADYHVSLKVDGEFNMLAYADGEALLVNPGGTVRVGLPVVKEAADMLRAAGVSQALIAGELWYSKSSGKRPRVHDVSRVARQPASLSELEGLCFAAFDLVELDGAPFVDSHERTWKRLCEYFQRGNRCKVVESEWVKDGLAVQGLFEKWVAQGAEGAVVRSDAVGTFKVKSRHTIDAAVIGFTEGQDDRRGMIHDLLLALMRPDGNLHVLGHVGGGFSVTERQTFLSDLKDMIVRSDYLEVNDQVAYHMVRPEWVVEISVLDLISHNTRGMPIKSMVIKWNRDTYRYEVVRRLPMVHLTSPQFIRRREDKTINPVDIRMRQVSDLVEIPLADRDATQLNLPASTLLKRQVCTKELKGQLMVRKLVMWKTNKEVEAEEYPAYVIHYTDYSPNRKTPLEREIRVSSSRDQIEELWEELAADAFTKGWVPVAGSAPGTASTAAPPAAAPPSAAPAPLTPKKRSKAADMPVETPPPTADAPSGTAAAPKRSRKKTE